MQDIATCGLSIIDPEAVDDDIPAFKHSPGEDEDEAEVELDLSLFSTDCLANAGRKGHKSHVFARAETYRGEWDLDGFESEPSEKRRRISSGPVVQK